MTRRNRFTTNSLNDLNTRRRIQENNENEECGFNRESRRANGDRNHVITMPDNMHPISDSILIGSYSSMFGSYDERFDIYDEERKIIRYIKSYNYSPDKFIFSSLEEEKEECKLFLGTEIEIDCAGEDEENAKWVNENLENCYTVHDGSLTRGFEIVTQPSTIKYHKQMNYRKVFEWLSKKGYKSHDTKTCGLHIHVNRDYLSKNKTVQDLCITKILFLLEKYWKEVVRIARRDSNSYSQKIKRDSDEDSLFDLLYKAKGSGYFSGAKYNCLNLLHKETIEFRIFKGTLKYETYMATLEFVKNIVDVCKKVSLEDIQSITFENIININKTEYLVDYLKFRKIN